MDGLYEMLPQQKKIWEVQTAYPGTDVCNIGGYLHLEGKYDVLLLQKTTLDMEQETCYHGIIIKKE